MNRDFAGNNMSQCCTGELHADLFYSLLLDETVIFVLVVEEAVPLCCRGNCGQELSGLWKCAKFWEAVVEEHGKCQWFILLRSVGDLIRKSLQVSRVDFRYLWVFVGCGCHLTKLATPCSRSIPRSRAWLGCFGLLGANIDYPLEMRVYTTALSWQKLVPDV